MQTEIDTSNIHKHYFGNINTLDEDISDSREVEFSKAEFAEIEGKRCIQMTLRNTMPYMVDIDLDSFSNNQRGEYYKKFDLKKISLE